MIDRSAFDRVLNEEELLLVAGQLDQLIRVPEWLTYVEVVRLKILAAREAALDGPTEQIPHWKGMVEGLKHLIEMPREIIEQARAVVKKDEKRGEVSEYRGRLTDDGDPSFG